MQVICEQITAVGNDGGQGDLNLRIVDRLCDLASCVPHTKPENRSPYDCQEKLPDSFSSTESAGNHSSKQNLENDHSRPVIQQTLTLNDDRKPLVHLESFEDGKHGDGICGGDDRTE